MKNKAIIELAEEIEKYSEEIAKRMAINTREKLYIYANETIDKFYNHYTPLYYNRLLPYGINIKKSIKKYYTNNHYKSYSGGIEISSIWMDDIYRADKDYVFNLVYAGYHGNVNMFPFQVNTIPPTMFPSPLNLILSKKDTLIKNSNNDANKIAREIKQKYKYIN